ncbi:hypothetical protein [Achromobacter sp. 2789STDY5608633]|uniref:hypothetical protein n=1 Tax=Achromobacter sp. 2789STDY5608633 TaxID=1806501 RepID=UPI000A84D886|nr:hypothetical protein [Achromobacter sp. 2789STDY5608633]
MNEVRPVDILQNLVDEILEKTDDAKCDLIDLGRKIQVLIEQGHSKRYVLAASGIHKWRVDQSLKLASAPSKILDLYKSGACTNIATLLYLKQIHQYDQSSFDPLYLRAKQGALPSVEAQIVAQECLSRHKATRPRASKVPYRSKTTFEPACTEEDMLERLESVLS